MTNRCDLCSATIPGHPESIAFCDACQDAYEHDQDDDVTEDGAA